MTRSIATRPCSAPSKTPCTSSSLDHRLHRHASMGRSDRGGAGLAPVGRHRPRRRHRLGGWLVGDGVTAANVAGRTLADLVLGRDSDLTRLPWVQHRSRRWEPEPLRWLGSTWRCAPCAVPTMSNGAQGARHCGRGRSFVCKVVGQLRACLCWPMTGGADVLRYTAFSTSATAAIPRASCSTPAASTTPPCSGLRTRWATASRVPLGRPDAATTCCATSARLRRCHSVATPPLLPRWPWSSTAHPTSCDSTLPPGSWRWRCAPDRTGIRSPPSPASRPPSRTPMRRGRRNPRRAGVGESDLDPRLPPRRAFAGAHHLVLGVRSRARLASLAYDFERLRA